MRTPRPNDPSLRRRYSPSAAIEKTVRSILAEVRSGGDEALVRLTKKFGGPKLKPGELRVTPGELALAGKAAGAQTRRAVKEARANVLAFAKRGLRKDWRGRNRHGVEVGERFDPFLRVGIYVPGGTAPLVSTAIMTVALAVAAGVPEIVVATPANASGAINPDLLYALAQAGATEIIKAGGAQAIAALAYGTAAVKPVLKIFGPGNAYVVEAKRQVFGAVAVDLLPGPSEILVIADETGNPDWIAADLLAQAEHGKGSSVGLLTTSPELLSAVKEKLAAQRRGLNRVEHLAEGLENAFVILVKEMDEAVEIANEFAPEHLAIVARDEEALARRIRTAGAIFLGGMSPVVGGDFIAGPSHELPTGGAGKSFSGLTVDQFQRRTSIVRFDRKSLAASLPAIEAFSEIEGLDAHGRSAAIRLQ